MAKKGFLPNAAWKTVLRNAVIPTADLVITRSNGAGFEFLLGKRKNRPARGKWFIPGGRQHKGEALEKTARRQIRGLGIGKKDIVHVKFMDFQDFSGVNNFGIRYHSLMHIFLVVVTPETKAKKAGDHSAMKWFKAVNPGWQKAVRKALAKASIT